MRLRFLCHLFMVLTVICTNAVCFADNNAAATIRWAYQGQRGPTNWGRLDPSFKKCSTGKNQSPIHITGRIKPTSKKLVINYIPAPLNLINDGATRLQIGHEYVLINDGHTVQANFPIDIEEVLELAGERYRMLQFHFHMPSENKLQNASYPLELHFVHQGLNGKIAVLAVFAKVGPPNLELQSLVDHLPKTKGVQHVIPGKSIDPLNLLPKQTSFYSFVGSLTTPPCSERVLWIVLRNPITLSADQLARIKNAINANNARPLQPLNHRSIETGRHITIVNPGL